MDAEADVPSIGRALARPLGRRGVKKAMTLLAKAEARGRVKGRVEAAAQSLPDVLQARIARCRDEKPLRRRVKAAVRAEHVSAVFAAPSRRAR